MTDGIFSPRRPHEKFRDIKRAMGKVKDDPKKLGVLEWADHELSTNVAVMKKARVMAEAERLVESGLSPDAARWQAWAYLPDQDLGLLCDDMLVKSILWDSMLGENAAFGGIERRPFDASKGIPGKVLYCKTCNARLGSALREVRLDAAENSAYLVNRMAVFEFKREIRYLEPCLVVTCDRDGKRGVRLADLEAVLPWEGDGRKGYALSRALTPYSHTA